MNLRPATKSQNAFNIVKYAGNFSSSHLGVSWAANCAKWNAHITVDGKTYNLGDYETEDQAVAARRSAEHQYYGDFRKYRYEEQRADLPEYVPMDMIATMEQILCSLKDSGGTRDDLSRVLSELDKIAAPSISIQDLIRVTKALLAEWRTRFTCDRCELTSPVVVASIAMSHRCTACANYLTFGGSDPIQL